MIDTTLYTDAADYGADPVTFVYLDTTADPWLADSLSEEQLLEYWRIRAGWDKMAEPEWPAVQHEMEMTRPTSDHFYAMERGEENVDGWRWLVARSYIDLRAGAC